MRIGQLFLNQLELDCEKDQKMKKTMIWHYKTGMDGL
jgi:hypothetical protein